MPGRPKDRSQLIAILDFQNKIADALLGEFCKRPGVCSDIPKITIECIGCDDFKLTWIKEEDYDGIE